MVPCRASSTYNFAPRRMKQIAVHGTLDAFVWERVRQLREMTSSTMKTEQRKSSLSHPRNSCPHIVYIRHRSCCATDFFFFLMEFGLWTVYFWPIIVTGVTAECSGSNCRWTNWFIGRLNYFLVIIIICLFHFLGIFSVAKITRNRSIHQCDESQVLKID